MKKIKIPYETMIDILYDNIGGEVIKNNIIDHDRWSVIHKLIFRYNDKFYKTTYSVGATEYQDEPPWENQDEIDCIEVKQVPKTIMVWESVEDE